MPATKKNKIAFADPAFFRRFRRYYTYIEPVITDPLVQSYLEIFASLSLITILIFFALSPTITTILGLLKKIADQKTVVAAMDSKITNLIAAQDSYNQVVDSLPLLTIVLPNKPAPEMVLTEVTREASSSGVNLSGFQIGAIALFGDPRTTVPAPIADQSKTMTADSTNLPAFKLSLAIDGDFVKVRTFLTNFEQKEERLMRISSLSLSRGDQGSLKQPGTFNAVISGYTYYLQK